MAYFARANGDAQPVFALDTANGAIPPGTSTAGTPVQPQGPKLDFFQITMANTMAAQQGVNGYVSNVLQAIQQTSTVAIYQVDGAQLSLALYPNGAFANTTVLLAAANVAGVAGTNQCSSATNVGFKLATS